ncbi:hypothetical protein ACFL6C_11470 [Myxococcota bacterium]
MDYVAAEDDWHLCDGLDNDCDGDTDADDLDFPNGMTSPPSPNPCRPFGLNTGVCLDLFPECGDPDSGTNAVFCSFSLSYEADDELTCDGQDNDCDGEEDEPGDDPLVITPVTPAGDQSGNVIVSWTLSGQACSVDVTVEVELDGSGIWLPATPGAHGNPMTGLETSDTASYEFEWVSLLDTGKTGEYAAVLRFTPSLAGTPAATMPFTVVNGFVLKRGASPTIPGILTGILLGLSRLNTLEPFPNHFHLSTFPLRSVFTLNSAAKPLPRHHPPHVQSRQAEVEDQRVIEAGGLQVRPHRGVVHGVGHTICSHTSPSSDDVNLSKSC